MLNKKKQWFYKYVTTPIAKTMDFVNIPKQIKLRKIRSKIAEANKHDYIETTSKILFETEVQEKMAMGMIPNPLMLPVLIEKQIQRATEMFYEKKALGYFDELNIMVVNDD